MSQNVAKSWNYSWEAFLFFFNFGWGTHLYTSFFPSVHPSVLPTGHLLCTISQLLVHMCKMMMSGRFCFLFFHFFKILIFGAVMKNKSYICHVPDLRNSIAWLWLLINLSKMISQGVFFIFPKFWFSGKKMIQNDKKFDHCCPYFRKHSIWPSFVVHKKWWYLLVFFSFFQNLDFSGC